MEKNVTLVGDLKQVGEVIVRPTSGRWVVAEPPGLAKDASDVFELYVKHARQD